MAQTLLFLILFFSRPQPFSFLLPIFILTSVSKFQWKFSFLKKPYLSISALRDLSLQNTPKITQHNIYVIYHKTQHVII